jgi:hypothetical protein
MQFLACLADAAASSYDVQISEVMVVEPFHSLSTVNKNLTVAFINYSSLPHSFGQVPRRILKFFVPCNRAVFQSCSIPGQGWC